VLARSAGPFANWLPRKESAIIRLPREKACPNCTSKLSRSPRSGPRPSRSRQFVGVGRTSGAFGSAGRLPCTPFRADLLSFLSLQARQPRPASPPGANCRESSTSRGNLRGTSGPALPRRHCSRFSLLPEDYLRWRPHITAAWRIDWRQPTRRGGNWSVRSHRVIRAGCADHTHSFGRQFQLSLAAGTGLFGPPTSGLSSLGRNVLPSPSYASIDVSLQKRITITEGHSIQMESRLSI